MTKFNLCMACAEALKEAYDLTQVPRILRAGGVTYSDNLCFSGACAKCGSKTMLHRYELRRKTAPVSSPDT